MNCGEECKCDPYELDISKWVFSPYKDGGWFCMKCLTHMGFWRDGVGDEDWRPTKDINLISKPKKKSLLKKLGGWIK